MCKFCDEIKYTNICHYDNGCGNSQNFGIGVSAWCGIKGNMLSLEAGGHRWTRADDYYESEGLDIDGESAVRTKSAIIKINFCPFCGKKLTDKTYQKEIAERELPVIEKQLDSLKYLTSYYGCVFRTQEYEKDITKLKDKATIFIPIFSETRTDIVTYHSTNRSLDVFDYEGMLPFTLKDEWDLQYSLPYSKDLFFNLGNKEFNSSWSWGGYERNTGMLIINNIADVEDLFDSIKDYNKKWKWNKNKTLNEINDFHNSVLNKIEELENRKIEIQKDNE